MVPRLFESEGSGLLVRGLDAFATGVRGSGLLVMGVRVLCGQGSRASRL